MFSMTYWLCEMARRDGRRVQARIRRASGRCADRDSGAFACATAVRSTAGRPRIDALKGSRHPNMKELRFSAADGEWRVAFAFDPRRRAILLVAGDKSGGSEKRFYRELIRKADSRFAAHLAQIGRGA